MKKIQDNQGQAEVFLENLVQSKTIQNTFENPEHSRTFQDSGHHVSPEVKGSVIIVINWYIQVKSRVIERLTI